MTEEVILKIACKYCKKEQKTKPNKAGGLKLPMGWKREGEDPVCKDCWRERYILRALTFGVASTEPRTWKELDTELKVMWAQTTAASNWMMTQCYVRDTHRDGSLQKMPPFPTVYLYPEDRILFPNLPPQTIVCLEHAIQSKYRAKRYDIVWLCSAALPSMRYPQPYPMHNQSWEYWLDEQSRPWVKFRLGTETWSIRLKSGMRYRRQIQGLRRMVEQGEMAIYKANDGTTMVKLVGWLRREKERIDGESTLIVRTGKDHLLSAFDTKEERLWIENCDHLPRLIAEHAKKIRRLAEDQKAEQRPVPSFADVRSKAVVKYRNRIDSAIKEAAAHLAGFALRRKFAKVTYNDEVKWLDPFPYFQLENRIKTILDEKGIQFEKLITTEPRTSEGKGSKKDKSVTSGEESLKEVTSEPAE